jgi:hypothetical protein
MTIDHLEITQRLYAAYRLRDQLAALQESKRKPCASPVVEVAELSAVAHTPVGSVG